MGLENVAVVWPRTGRYYDPVAAAEFADFAQVAEAPDVAAPTATLASHIAHTGTVQAGAYAGLVDLLFGVDGVLTAADAAEEGEEPVIDPDGCAWIAGGLERFLDNHARHATTVTFDSVGTVLRQALSGGRLAEAQLRWLEERLQALRGRDGTVLQWRFPLSELTVLARFYRRCAQRGFAVYATA